MCQWRVFRVGRLHRRRESLFGEEQRMIFLVLLVGMVLATTGPSVGSEHTDDRYVCG